MSPPVITHLTDVVGVDSGLDEEGIIWGQTALELCFLVLRLVVQLQEGSNGCIDSVGLIRLIVQQQQLSLSLLLSQEGSSVFTGLPPQPPSDHRVYSGPTECLLLFILQRDGSPVSMVPTERQLGASWMIGQILICTSEKFRSKVLLYFKYRAGCYKNLISIQSDVHELFKEPVRVLYVRH